MSEKLANALELFLSSERNIAKWPDEEERRAAAVALTAGNVQGMEPAYDFILTLSDSEVPDWVHLMTYGTMQHPVFGEMDITPEKVANMVKNFQKKVRGVMLDIDYSHKRDPSKGDKAAGWIVALDQRDDGLWGKISWTSEAAAEIADGAWKYMSVEFTDKFCTSKEPIKCYEDVLNGAALTNRPFIKDLTPINFDDFFPTPPGKFPAEDASYRMASDSMYRCSNCAFYRDNTCLLVEGEIEADYTCDYFKPIYNDVMDSMYSETPKEVEVDELMKKLRMALKLADDADEETILGAITVEAPKVEEPAKLTEEAKAKKFADDYPEEAERMKTLEENNRSLDTEAKLSEWRKGAKGGLPVSLDETIKEYRAALSDPAKFDEIISGIVTTGLVPTKPLGSSKTEEASDDPQEAFLSEVKKFQEENKNADMKAAVTAVAKANPGLAKEYYEGRASLSTDAAEGGEE